MHQRARTGFGQRAGRLLALVAVLVGLIAMHGLASSHHAPAAAAGHIAPAAEPQNAAHPHHVTVAQPQVESVVWSPQQAVSEPAAPAASCDDDCGALVTLCLAVLAAAIGVVMAVAIALRLGSAVVARGVRPGPARACARAGTPPPDPVRELCVSRT